MQQVAHHLYEPLLGDDIGHPGGVVFGEREEQRFLVLEMMEDRAPGQTGGLFEAAHCRALVTEPREAGPRAVKDLATPRVEVILADPRHSVIVAGQSGKMQSVRTYCYARLLQSTVYSGTKAVVPEQAWCRVGRTPSLVSEPRQAVSIVAPPTGPDIREHSIPDPREADYPSSRVRTRAEAEAYVARVCFKQGPPRLLGVELEWTVHHRDDPRRPLDAEVLASALGRHAPPTLVPDSPHVALPHGSTLTLEPGGQVEVSSPPLPDLRNLLTVVAADAAYLRELAARWGLLLAEQGVDPWRCPRRILRVPRYAALETSFDRVGSSGRMMMCGTAGVQVCLDVGEEHRIAARWAALHALGPVLVAAFANSPRMLGEETGWVSTRTRVLLGMDPSRHYPAAVTEDPASSWARRVVNTEIVCARRDGTDWTTPSGISFAEWVGFAGAVSDALPHPPTRDDLHYHLTTVFPPVRPQGYFEVRFLDAQPGQDWMLPVAVLSALFNEEDTVDKVRDIAAPAEGCWARAARSGLCDPVLANCARSVLDLASRRLAEMDGMVEISRRLATFVGHRLESVPDR